MASVDGMGTKHGIWKGAMSGQPKPTLPFFPPPPCFACLRACMRARAYVRLCGIWALSVCPLFFFCAPSSTFCCSCMSVCDSHVCATQMIRPGQPQTPLVPCSLPSPRNIHAPGVCELVLLRWSRCGAGGGRFSKGRVPVLFSSRRVAVNPCSVVRHSHTLSRWGK